MALLALSSGPAHTLAHLAFAGGMSGLLGYPNTHQSRVNLKLTISHQHQLRAESRTGHMANRSHSHNNQYTSFCWVPISMASLVFSHDKQSTHCRPRTVVFGPTISQSSHGTLVAMVKELLSSAGLLWILFKHSGEQGEFGVTSIAPTALINSTTVRVDERAHALSHI